MKYPYGPFYKLLMLTGQRLLEIGHAEWREIINLEGEWTDVARKDGKAPLLLISAGRMKGEDGERQSHSVPLAPVAAEILRSLPKHSGWRWVFAFSKNGPVNGWSKAKAELDRRMQLALRAYARMQGNKDWRGVELAPFVNHDVRRTVRTRLSSLRVPQTVAEQVIAHTQTGIVGVYDVHRYDAEKGEALALWEDRLLSIVGRPRPDNVVALKTKRV
jgi:integrase